MSKLGYFTLAYLILCTLITFAIALLHVIRFPGSSRYSARIALVICSPAYVIMALGFMPETLARLIASLWQKKLIEEEHRNELA